MGRLSKQIEQLSKQTEQLSERVEQLDIEVHFKPGGQGQIAAKNSFNQKITNQQSLQ